MDLNSLYFSHQLLLMRASSSTCRDHRDRHLAKADAVAGQIASIQRHSGAGARHSWGRNKVGHHAIPALSLCECTA